MKTEGKITILIGSDSTTIEIKDSASSVTFVKVTLTPEQLSMSLSRLAYTPCIIETRGLDVVGKKMEHKYYEFEIPKELRSSNKSEELDELANSQLTDGWVSEGYYSSQDSFFERDGKNFARVIIRRYI